MTPPKILLATSELFPEFGYPTAGGGVRAAQLFNSLKAEGFQVDLALARSSGEGKKLPEWASQFLYRPGFFDGVIEQADPDVILSEGWEPLSHLRHEEDRVVVADCPGPLILENSLREVGDLRQNVFHKVRSLAKTDAVLAPTDTMRSYLTGFLALAGWSPDDSHRVLQVPIALPQDLPPRKARPENFVFYVGGVNWAWHRTSNWLLDFANALESKAFGSIRTRLGKHPHHAIEGESYDSLDTRIENHPRIQAEDLTDWDTLVAELGSASVAIEWSPEHFEREVASPLRIATYLWCGLPVIVRPHLEVARWIREFDAGWVVESWEDLLNLLEDLKTHPQSVEIKSTHAQSLARARHTWPSAHSDLISFLKTPTKRASGGSFLEHATRTFERQEEDLCRLREEASAWKEEREHLLERLSACEADAESFRAMRQKLPYKIWKKLTG
jgi:hypothetical protein